MYIVKRSGRREKFDPDKIRVALDSANESVEEKDKISKTIINNIVEKIEKLAEEKSTMFTVEDIQDTIEQYLITINKYELSRSYIRYRYKKELARDKYSELMSVIADKIACKDIQNQNANLDEKSFGGRLGETTSLIMKQYALDYCVAPKTRENHLNNEVYIHDLDAYAIGSHNCLSYPFDKSLNEGFNTRQTDVRAAGSVCTAMQLIAVCFQIQSLSQFGGVSSTHIDSTMVPFVKKSFYKHFKDGLKYAQKYKQRKIDKVLSLINKNSNIEDINYQKSKKAYKYAIEMTERECHQAVEAMFHNLNTLQSRSGNQLPFSSINFGLATSSEGRLIGKEILKICREGLGKFNKTSIFPCVIFQCKNGINRNPKDPNYDLFKMALQCTSERLYPNYANCDWSSQKSWVEYDRKIKKEIIESLTAKEKNILIHRLEENPKLKDILYLFPDLTIDLEEKPTEIFSTMGCRTANGADVNFKKLYEQNIKSVIETGNVVCDTLTSAAQKDGRGNICPTTIILPTLAMEANRDVNKFISLLKRKIEEAKDSLIDRFEWICSQSPDSAKFMYENKLMAGYIPEEGIRSALKHGTLAIGMLGLAEALELLVGCNHTQPEGMKLAKEICNIYKEKCNKFKEEYSLNFGVYYTPAENLCYTAMKKFQQQYGIINRVSDHEYFTNSMHIPVWEEIDAFKKIKLESELTGYSSAGCITYVELDSSVRHNIAALESMVNYAMNHDIPYFAINVPVDMCMDCGYENEINDEKCPKCGSTNIQRLRRVTGYLTGNFTTAFNKGKQEEVEDRVKHTGVEIS